MLLAQSAPLLNELQCLALLFVIFSLTAAVLIISAVMSNKNIRDD